MILSNAPSSTRNSGHDAETIQWIFWYEDGSIDLSLMKFWNLEWRSKEERMSGIEVLLKYVFVKNLEL